MTDLRKGGEQVFDGPSRSGSGDDLLRLDNVRFSYQPAAPVLRGISLSIKRATLTGLIGPNGAGKTTLVKLISRELKPTEGSIRIESHKSNRAPSVAVVDQHLSLFPDLSVAANICFSKWARDGLAWLTPAKLEREAESVSRQLGVDLHVGRNVRSLPYPLRQMVEIARCVYQGAELLILDEPTAALDNQSRQRLLVLLKTLVDQGTSVLLVTHDMDDLQGIADEVISIDDGRAESVAAESDFSLAEGEDSEFANPISNSNLTIGVRLPSGKAIEVQGHLGHTAIWHFEDAMERSLLAQIMAFSGGSDSCQISIGDRSFSNPSPLRLRAEGIGLLLSDRHTNGIFPELNVIQNYLVASGGTNSRFWIDGSGAIETALSQSGVKFPSLYSRASILSGGNQQRLLWRALSDSGCRFIVAEEPLWGLDREARRMAVQLMTKLNTDGRGVVVLTCFPRAYAGLPVYGLMRSDN
jgi:ribose transport system ATP-binding protein